MMARAQPIGAFASSVRAYTDRAAPESVRQWLMDTARQKEREGRASNRRALGADTPAIVSVDRREGAPLSAVKPDSRVVIEFEALGPVVDFALETLHRLSPVDEGTYVAGHRVLVNGREITLGERIRPDAVVTIENRVPYARAIEFGWSSFSPRGVYSIAAMVIRRKFRNISVISASQKWAEVPTLTIRQKRSRRIA